jgi:Troponin
LLKKAAEDIKADQEKKAQERRRALTETIGRDEHSSLEDAATLMAICKKYHHRIHQLQETKYDLEVVVRKRDYMVGGCSNL